LPGGTDTDDWRGFRLLDNDKVTALAEAIVAQVKERGPFVSLADFVNRRLSSEDANDANLDSPGLSGPLQAAIDATATINANFSDQVYLGDISDQKDVVDSYNVPYPDQAVGATAAAATGYLLQSDLLMSLGPVLSARSDTFTIRAYGDHEDSVTGQKSIALCEAIVQRLPEYIDDSDEAELTPALASVNKDFGRRFVIRSIRWLD
jgi:hypothetical protein